MYKLKAEYVDGLKVYALGRAFKIIGNKPLKVGDTFWTDGKCAYGFYKVRQKPPIIIKPKENFIIPIVSTWAYANYDRSGTYPKRLSELAYFTIDDDLKLAEHNAEYGRADDWNVMVNNSKGELYLISKAIAANIDNDGNIYRIRGYYLDTDADDMKGRVEVKKNDEVIFSRDFEHAYYSNGGVSWGFIEDENRWAFVFSQFQRTYDVGQPDKDDPDSLHYDSEKMDYYTEATVNGGDYYINSAGAEICLASYSAKIIMYRNHTLPTTHDYIADKQENFDNVPQSVMFPIQGGYFKLDKIISSGEKRVDTPTVALTTIYNPAGEIVCRDYFLAHSYFILLKIYADEYLLSVRHTGGSSTVFSEYDDNFKYPDFIGNGLYLCSGGKIAPVANYDDVFGGIEDSELGFIKYKTYENILNQRFCPMKDYTDWHYLMSTIL